VSRGTVAMSLKPVDIVAGVDIGGSHIGVGLFNNQTKQQLCTQEESINSSIPPEQLIDRIALIVKQLQRQIDYKTSLIAIGIGCPGQSKNGTLVAASNFKTWKMVPLADMISAKLDHIPATLINDADAAIAAEVWGTNHYTNIRNAAMISKSTTTRARLTL
jgi:predicted NBD/HSP70 family sugar kinase